MKFETKVIHAAIKPDPSTGAIMTPIFQTSTYVQTAPGEHKGYEYARTHNPTRETLEKNLAALENGKHGLAFSSGLAAMDAVLKILRPGDEIICTNDLYGGSYRLIRQIFEPFGIVAHFIDLSDPDNLTKSINDKTKLVWLETPTNPLIKLLDLEALCSIAKENNVLVAVDNTFASPFNQNPLDLGADIVHHSATKYIGGHSDLIMGILVVSSDELEEKFRFIQNASGAIPGPQDCFLCLRGIKTLHLRMERSADNAMTIAQFLENHPLVKTVNYPGLESSPYYELAKRQMRTPGAMISFELKNDDMSAAKTILSTTNLFSLAESLGGVESLIGHPASMTHASIPREERIANGLSDTLIRLSVGIESADDLIADLDQAISKTK